MNWHEAANRIPVEPIAEVIRSYLDDEGTRLSDGTFCPGSVYTLAERADIHGDTLEKMLAGRSQTIDFDDADKLLCAINMTDLWVTNLSDVYASAILDDTESRRRLEKVSGARICERRGCSVMFVPPPRVPGKKFCSKACQSASWAHKTRGVKTQLRGKGNSLTGLVCKNGHQRTSENTRVDYRGKTVCMTCKRAADQRKHERPRGGEKKLDIDQVREIRASSESLAVLGRRFGVHKSTIGLVRNRKTWANED